MTPAAHYCCDKVRLLMWGVRHLCCYGDVFTLEKVKQLVAKRWICM